LEIAAREKIFSEERLDGVRGKILRVREGEKNFGCADFENIE